MPPLNCIGNTGSSRSIVPTNKITKRGRFEFQINAFNAAANSPVRSPLFYVGGHFWDILYHPKGGPDGCISITLVREDGVALPVAAWFQISIRVRDLHPGPCGLDLFKLNRNQVLIENGPIWRVNFTRPFASHVYDRFVGKRQLETKLRNAGTHHFTIRCDMAVYTWKTWEDAAVDGVRLLPPPPSSTSADTSASSLILGLTQFLSECVTRAISLFSN